MCTKTFNDTVLYYSYVPMANIIFNLKKKQEIMKLVALMFFFVIEIRALKTIGMSRIRAKKKR